MSSVVINGDSSGSITLQAPAVSGSNVLSLPAVTDTLVGIAATQTLTNKTLVAPSLGTPLALVLTNATGLPTAGLLDASVTNAKLANGYPNQDYVSPVSLPVTNGGTANTYYNISSISIPSAGLWRIWTNIRWASASISCFVRLNLSSSTSSGGILGSGRMQIENMQASTSNLNVGIASEWYFTFGTGITYPYTLYLGFFQGNTSGNVFLQNDSNGISVASAMKFASTTSTGSAPVQIGS
jgi:hypothetical protein